MSGSGVNISARAAEVHFHPRFGAFVAGVCSLGFMRITFGHRISVDESQSTITLW
jgi:hypothetical protein